MSLVLNGAIKNKDTEDMDTVTDMATVYVDMVPNQAGNDCSKEIRNL